MTDSLLINEFIYDRINSSEEVQDYIDGRLWPIVAPWTRPEDVHYPFIVYTRNSVNVSSITKDCYPVDSVQFQIDIISSKYNESVSLANIIRGLFDGRYFETEKMAIGEIKMTAAKESFNDESFIQTLTFTADVMNV